MRFFYCTHGLVSHHGSASHGTSYITLHSPGELDWCADTHSQQGADEDKTCSCLLETPVVAWHHTKGRKKGPNFWGFFYSWKSFDCHLDPGINIVALQFELLDITH